MNKAVNRIILFFEQLIASESSATKFAQSFCVGVYIAFSPFVGGHTIMVFLFSWLFRLNLAITFAVSCIINNPLTAAPVYLLDYIFGYWLLHIYAKTTYFQHNPDWLYWLERLCTTYIGAKPCIWSFLIGGNILGIASAIVCYPIIKYLVYSTSVKSNRTIT